jgi:hypothetical protein
MRTVPTRLGDRARGARVKKNLRTDNLTFSSFTDSDKPEFRPGGRDRTVRSSSSHLCNHIPLHRRGAPVPIRLVLVEYSCVLSLFAVAAGVGERGGNVLRRRFGIHASIARLQASMRLGIVRKTPHNSLKSQDIESYTKTLEKGPPNHRATKSSCHQIRHKQAPKRGHQIRHL